MTLQDLRKRQQQLVDTIAQLQSEGAAILAPQFWLDSTGNGRTNKIYYRKRWFDALGGKQSAPLAQTEYENIKAAIARGQKLQALEQEKQQVVAALEHLTTFATQHGLLLPPQKSHDCALQHSSDSNEWYTDPFWVNRARMLMGGLDLDPASSAEAQLWIQATNYYTRDDDGLQQPWWGNLWLNPPYGKRNHSQGIYGATAWVNRAIAEYEAGHVTQAVLWLRAGGNAGIRALEQRGFPRVTLGRIPHAPAGAHGVLQKAVGHDTVVWYLGPRIEQFYDLFVPPTSGKHA